MARFFCRQFWKKRKSIWPLTPKKKVDPKVEKKYLTLLNRRLLGWPVAYLIKEKEFFGHKFYVDKNVLIPRPETEGLVELVLSKLKTLPKSTILDIGTGSGNIIISIAAKAPRNTYLASDISNKALTVAKKNAKQFKVKIKFRLGNLIEPFIDQDCDIIVANLPYLHRETDDSTKFEPKGALIAAKKGLALYEQLFRQIKKFELTPKYICLEIGRDQGRLIKKLAKKILPAYETKVYKDLFGRTRYVILSQQVPLSRP